MSTNGNNDEKKKGAKFWQRVQFKHSGVIQYPEFNGVDTVELDNVFADIPEKEIAKVTYSKQYKHNLGNYESAQVSVGITIPCHVSDIDSGYDFAKEFIDKKLDSLNKEIDSNLAENKGSGHSDTNIEK